MGQKYAFVGDIIMWTMLSRCHRRNAGDETDVE